MINNCMKSITRWKPLSGCWNILEKTNRSFASFTIKDILYETSDEAGTLLTRFAKHVAIERQKICEEIPTKVQYADYFPVSDIRYFQRELSKTPTNQLASVIVFASSYRPNADPGKFAIILNEMDKFAMENVEKMDADTILRTLYSFLFLIPNWMTKLDFYTAAMKNLLRNAQKDCESKELFIQTCFYFGLSKNLSRGNLANSWKLFVEAHLSRFLPQMGVLDLALVASAIYKTSTKIENENFNQRLVDGVLSFSLAEGGNDALLITFIKSLRFQRVNSTDVCKHLTNICTNPNKLRQFQPRGQIHMFAFFADNLWDNSAAANTLVDEFIRNLKMPPKNTYADRVRGKDIASFLWCCSQLNYRMSREQFCVVEDNLLEKVQKNEFVYFPDQLVESCLSLWILGFKSKELLHHAVSLKLQAQSKRHQPKVDSRLTVLLSAAHIEEPTWCSSLPKSFKSFDLNSAVPQYLLNTSIPYQAIISQLCESEKVSSVKIACPISGINIPGLVVKTSTSNTPFFVEFMTESQTLLTSRQPVAILRLKIQLLQSMGHKVRVLTPEDLVNPLDENDILDIETNAELSRNSIKS
ncbi:uncharacterized protein LOC106086892 [Stomoxys calcitrans]|uniref:RAP domain-containing protein n=1 Tax=Stomoxys calcitrans TaxID=35570 RepID=A0A1I8NRY7_STOCA|nr:uncharacterized protein LOC106086892 [Stomoxys calcitrans]